MIYILAGAALIAMLVWAGRGGLRGMDPGGVRVSAGVVAVLALVAAGLFTLRGIWPIGLLLLLVAMGSAVAARKAPRAPKPTVKDPSLAEARSILGVGPDASEDDIQEAYTRLMRVAHPDAGGTSGLAAQLNAARDRLLRG